MDPLFFKDVFSARVIEHAAHCGYYIDADDNLRCDEDDELVVPSPAWIRGREPSERQAVDHQG